MFRSMFLGLFIILSVTKEVSSIICPSGIYNSYYCSAGQSCGSYYGDCRGLPTYLIFTIVSFSLVLCSICIRCCVYISSNNSKTTTQRVLVPQGPVHSFRNNLATQPPVSVPVHSFREDAPPSYGAVVAAGAQPIKY
ncbi:unnamed protein product [Adineta steineri]|uniref:Uncharacterized protein n=1 Tax=Adineta steineri TaxID=433720 RepID=A0A814VHT9_9BILA|nr:unnamed protein product [Adineta steineri]CAF4246816.1 unnamed protein product [Adineta steineri]